MKRSYWNIWKTWLDDKIIIIICTMSLFSYFIESTLHQYTITTQRFSLYDYVWLYQPISHYKSHVIYVIQSMHSMSHYMKNQLQKLTACLRMNNFYILLSCVWQQTHRRTSVFTGVMLGFREDKYMSSPGIIMRICRAVAQLPPKCHTPRNQKRPY